MRHAIGFSLAVAALAVAGCATSGIGTGRLQTPGKPEGADEAVQFTWHSSADATHGTLDAMLPDGRTFAGNFLQITSTTQGQDLGPYWGGGWGPWGGYSSVAYARHYSGRVIGQLSGPEGQMMRCQFQLAHPEDGPRSGGQGQCTLSTGETIDYAELGSAP